MNDAPGAVPPESPSAPSKEGSPPSPSASPSTSADGERPSVPSPAGSTRKPSKDATGRQRPLSPPTGHGPFGGPPPAAKPGVIPLRPLSVGEILEGAVAAMRAHWRTALGISLSVALVTETLVTIATGLWFRDTGSLERLSRDENPTLQETLDAMGDTLAGAGVTALVGLLGTMVVTAMLTVVVSRAVLGRPTSVGEAWRDSRPQLARLCGLLLLMPLLAAAVLTVGILPGLTVAAAGSAAGGTALVSLGLLAAVVVVFWLWVRLSLAPPALMLEKHGLVHALRRSNKLVRGSWWRVLGVQLVALLVLLFASGIVQLPADVIGRLASGESAAELSSGEVPSGWTYLVITGIGAVIASTFMLPLNAGVTALLYLDQRIRREALDLELARAAGVPGFAPRDDEAEPAT